MSTDAQAVWKRIKVPEALTAAGWQLKKSDSTAPYSMENEARNLTTGGYPDPQEAIEAAAIMDEAREDTGDRELEADTGPDKMPLNMIDEGWRLHTAQDGPNWYYFARRAEAGPTTEKHPTARGAIVQAIELEAARQRELEDRERAAAGTVGTRLLELAKIRRDGGTQQRVELNDHVIAEYAEGMAAGVKFPPIEVCFDGAEFWLVDGFYRVAAAERLHYTTIVAEVKNGTQREAVLFSLGANSEHGQPRTQADKRRAVTVMLEDQEWHGWSDNYIATYAHVSQPFVSKLRREFDAARKQTTSTVRKGKDKRTQETKRIGKPEKPDTRQMQIAELEGGPTVGQPAAQANDPKCTVCDIPITKKDFRNAAGECWDCSKVATHGKQKKQKKSKAIGGTYTLTSNGQTSDPIPFNAAPPTNAPSPADRLAALHQVRELNLTLHFAPRAKRVIVGVEGRNVLRRTTRVDVAAVQFAPAVVEWIAKAIATDRKFGEKPKPKPGKEKKNNGRSKPATGKRATSTRASKRRATSKPGKPNAGNRGSKQTRPRTRGVSKDSRRRATPTRGKRHGRK